MIQQRTWKTIALVAIFGMMAGCVVPREAGFPDVSQAVRQRTGYDVQWIRGEAEDALVAAAVAALLSDSLAVEEAVQIALLNNRRLQATYENLGVAQAEVVQAGLLRNPIFGGSAAWPLEGGGSPDLAFSVAFDFLGVLTIPLRRSVAASAFEAEKARVSEAVLNLAAQVRTGYYRAQANAQLLELMEQVLLAGEAGYLAARRLREAGNIRTLDLLNEQAQVEQTRLDQTAAELALGGSRERLNRLMGLSDGQIDWQLAVRPPAVHRMDRPGNRPRREAPGVTRDRVVGSRPRHGQPRRMERLADSRGIRGWRDRRRCRGSGIRRPISGHDCWRHAPPPSRSTTVCRTSAVDRAALRVDP